MAPIERLLDLAARKFDLKNLFRHVELESTSQNPRYLFISGIHLDELYVSKALKRWFKINPDDIPDALNIFRANPDRSLLKKRGILKWDKEKHKLKVKDVNRDFREMGEENNETESWAAHEIKQGVLNYPNLEVAFSFHGENDKDGYRDSEKGGIEKFPRDLSSFYMYDSFDPSINSSEEIMLLYQSLATALEEHGFSLYNGYDDFKNDPNETVQLNPVVNGYCPQFSNRENFIDGTFENWIVDQGLKGRTKIKRSFTFEIPGHIPKKRQQEMIDIIFREFILPFLRKES